MTLKRIFILVASLQLGCAFAGEGSSGGGGAFVCKNSADEVSQTHLIDLFEGEKIWGLNIQYSSESVDLQIKRALSKVKNIYPIFGKSIEAEIKSLFKNPIYLDSDVVLNTPTDARPNYGMHNCPFEGMMFYDGDIRRLVVKKEYFSKLASNTDIAASKVHEAAFKVIREEFGNLIGNSKPLRMLVACLFSDSSSCLVEKSTFDHIRTAETVFECTDDKLGTFHILKEVSSNPVWKIMINKIGNKKFSIPLFLNVPSTRGSQSFRGPLNSELDKYGIEFPQQEIISIDSEGYSNGNGDDSLNHPLTSLYIGENIELNCKKI